MDDKWITPRISVKVSTPRRLLGADMHGNMNPRYTVKQV
jgi:hypothetical protein